MNNDKDKTPQHMLSAAAAHTGNHVSAHQVHSLMLLYPRLVSLVWAPIVTPIILPVLFFTMNALTAGHAVLTAVLAALLWWGGIAAIHHYTGSASSSAAAAANSDDDTALDKALASNETRLPLLAITTSALVVHLTRWLLGDALAWYPSVSAALVWLGRCECAIIVLQVSVFLRYFGPLSIMRCSNVPLLSNPFESYFWFFVQYPGSIFEPGEHPSELLSAGIVPEEHRGRRYHHPAAAPFCMLSILYVIGGCLLFVCGLGGFPHAPAAAMTACILIVLSPLNHYVRQQNHEMDPRPYLNVSQGWSFDMTRQACMSAAWTASWIVSLAWIVDGVDERRYWVGSWTTLLHLAGFTWSCLCARAAWEECLRLALFYPRPNILQEILDMTDASHTACVETILQCLLVDAGLVQDVLATNRGSLNRENVVARTRSLSQQHGKQLLRKLPLYVEAPLEEDAVRFGILEALGGPNDRGIAQEWLDLVLPLMHGGMSPEPPCATLVRGFSVFLGGMGEALQNIVNQASIKPKERRLDSWELSTGGLVSLEFTLHAMTRWLSATPACKRTEQQLGQLVPAALTIMYQLHDALEKYRSYAQGITPNQDFVLLQKVLRTCESSAARLSTPLLERYKVNPAVDQLVWKWLVQTQDLVDDSSE